MSKARCKKKLVDTSVNRYWMEILLECANTYSTLKHLSVDNYKIGKVHPILRLGPYSGRAANKISVKVKLLTGTYILRTNRAVFNNTAVNPQCLLCKTEEETLLNFLIECPALQSVRHELLGDIVHTLSSETNTMFYWLDPYEQVQYIIDHHKVINRLKDNVSFELEHNVGYYVIYYTPVDINCYHFFLQERNMGCNTSHDPILFLWTLWQTFMWLRITNFLLKYCFKCIYTSIYVPYSYWWRIYIRCKGYRFYSSEVLRQRKDIIIEDEDGKLEPKWTTRELCSCTKIMSISRN